MAQITIVVDSEDGTEPMRITIAAPTAVVEAAVVTLINQIKGNRTSAKPLVEEYTSVWELQPAVAGILHRNSILPSELLAMNRFELDHVLNSLRGMAKKGKRYNEVVAAWERLKQENNPQ